MPCNVLVQEGNRRGPGCCSAVSTEVLHYFNSCAGRGVTEPAGRRTLWHCPEKRSQVGTWQGPVCSLLRATVSVPTL